MVPKKGIAGYLIGLLVSQLIISFLDGLAIYRYISITFQPLNWIVKPALIILFEGILIMHFYHYLTKVTEMPPLIILIVCCLMLAIGYFILLLITKSISLKEFKR